MLSKNRMEDILDEAALRGADFAEVFDESSLFQETWATPDGIEQNQAGRESGVGIRVFKGKDCYYGYTNDRSEKALKELTADLTKAMQGDSLAKVALKEKQRRPAPKL